VRCRLDVAGTLRDESKVDLAAPSFISSATPLQSVDALPSGGDVKVRCLDFGFGEVRGTT
jgi:hypothetical protein